MRHTNSQEAFLAGALIVTLSFSLPCQAQQKYTVTDLGTLSGGLHTEVGGINAVGQVVGLSPSGSGFSHAFRTAPNAVINPGTDDLGTLGGVISQATGINDTGQVVGLSFTAGGATHAFRTAPNAVISPGTDDLGTLGGGTSWAYGINAVGQVVGFFNPTADQTHAFRTTPNAAISPATDDLGGFVSVPVGTQAVAYGINAIGQVVGASYTGRATHAFRTSPNAAINPATDDLGTLGGSESTGLGINGLGQVVGYSDTVPGQLFLFHAFRTAPNAAINPATDDLGTLGGLLSIAFGINASGQVVGSAQIATGESHAFVYSFGAMQDLNNSIPVGSGWVLQNATSINDVGQTVGNGLHNGLVRAFRLDPIPDLTPPVIVPQITGTLGNNGWYRSNVTVTWSVADPESGITSSSGCNPTTITADTPGMALTCSATNGVGLSGSISVTVKIDKTPPVTTLALQGTLGMNGWYTSNVTITLMATDALSGSAGTQYSTNGGTTWTAYTAPVVLSTDGLFTLFYRSTDNAGNLEGTKSQSISIDKTPPTIAGMPVAQCSIWPPNHKLVQIAAVTATDSGSGVAPGSLSVRVTSNEPVAPGDFVIANGVVQVVADRLGDGNGRVYTVVAQAADVAGKTAMATGRCTVPHDHGK